MGSEIGESSISKLHIIPIFILLFCAGIVLSDFIDGERSSLMILKEHLDPTHKTILHGNWTKAHCYENISHWVGIRCSNGRASHLSLDSMGLDGSIPWDAFANVTELGVLSFKNNSLAGGLPDFAKVHLIKQIDFSHNKLNGSIPLSLVNLHFLEELYLQNNELTGSIPAFNQPSLKTFNVSNNHLTGSIPNTTVFNSFNESAYLGNDLMCGKKLSRNCSMLISPPSPSPTPPDSTQPITRSSMVRKNGGVSKDILVLICIATSAVILIIIILFASLYPKFISSRD